MNKSPRQTVKPAQRQAHDTEIGREKERDEIQIKERKREKWRRREKEGRESIIIIINIFL